VAGLCNKLLVVFNFGPDWSSRISTLENGINDIRFYCMYTKFKMVQIGILMRL
jgi:hypothetical protein